MVINVFAQTCAHGYVNTNVSENIGTATHRWVIRYKQLLTEPNDFIVPKFIRRLPIQIVGQVSNYCIAKKITTEYFSVILDYQTD